MRVASLFDIGPAVRGVARVSCLLLGLGLGCRSPAAGTDASSQPGPTRPTAAPATTAAASVHGRALPDRASEPCDGGHIGALDLVPAGMTSVVGIDIAAIARHPEYAQRRDVIETGELGRWIAAAGECGLGREHWRSATFAGDIDSLGNNGTVVLRVSGIGDRGRLQCMRNRLTSGEGKAPFDFVEGTERVELSLPNEGRGWVTNACTLVIANGTGVEGTRSRLLGSGTPLLSGPLGPVVARAGEHHHVWFAMRTTSAVLGGMTDWTMSLDLHSGFALNAMVQFADAQAAATAVQQVKQSLDAVRGSGMMPVPTRVLDSMSIGSTDRFMALAASGDARELTAIIDSVLGTMRTFIGP